MIYAFRNGQEIHGSFGSLLYPNMESIRRDSPDYMTTIESWYCHREPSRTTGQYVYKDAVGLLEYINLAGGSNSNAFGHRFIIKFTDPASALELMLKVREGKIAPTRPFAGPQVEKPTLSQRLTALMPTFYPPVEGAVHWMLAKAESLGKVKVADVWRKFAARCNIWQRS